MELEAVEVGIVVVEAERLLGLVELLDYMAVAFPVLGSWSLRYFLAA